MAARLMQSCQRWKNPLWCLWLERPKNENALRSWQQVSGLLATPASKSQAKVIVETQMTMQVDSDWHRHRCIKAPHRSLPVQRVDAVLFTVTVVTGLSCRQRLSLPANERPISKTGAERILLRQNQTVFHKERTWSLSYNPQVPYHMIYWSRYLFILCLKHITQGQVILQENKSTVSLHNFTRYQLCLVCFFPPGQISRSGWR